MDFSVSLTWVKGMAEHVCLVVSFRLTGRDMLIFPWSPFSMALCHICRPCLFFRSSPVGVSGRRWWRGLTGAFGARAKPGRPRDRKAGKGNLELREGAPLGARPRLKSPDWGRTCGLTRTTLTIPRTGSSGPLPDDSKSNDELLRMVLWGSV